VAGVEAEGDNESGGAIVLNVAEGIIEGFGVDRPGGSEGEGIVAGKAVAVVMAAFVCIAPEKGIFLVRVSVDRDKSWVLSSRLMTGRSPGLDMIPDFG
jgi:hypothetical protein